MDATTRIVTILPVVDANGGLVWRLPAHVSDYAARPGHDVYAFFTFSPVRVRVTSSWYITY
jgi:hypothetical protein